MKKLFTLFGAALLAFAVVSCGDAKAKKTKIGVSIPAADHGWTGAVMTYAQEKAQELNDAGKYAATVITSSDAANQIQQVEDLIENKTADYVVILPQDNTLENTMAKLATSGIPYVMFDRIIDSAASTAVACVKGDNNGIGAETAKRFIADGMKVSAKLGLIAAFGALVVGIVLGAVAALQRMRWTGNVRELRNAVERLTVLSGERITAEDVRLYC